MHRRRRLVPAIVWPCCACSISCGCPARSGGHVAAREFGSTKIYNTSLHTIQNSLMIHDTPQPGDHTHAVANQPTVAVDPRCPIKAEHPGPFSFVRWVAMASRAALCSRALLRVSATGNNSQRVVQSVRQLHCSAAAAGAWGALMAAVCHVASCARDCRADSCALWLLHCISRAWRVCLFQDLTRGLRRSRQTCSRHQCLTQSALL